ncbi:hypothetical protein [Streptomyces sp. SLBN-8D4]
MDLFDGPAEDAEAVADLVAAGITGPQLPHWPRTRVDRMSARARGVGKP